MRFFPKFKGVMPLLALMMGLAFITVDYAEAKRGLSFGSRGRKTFSLPKATNTAPKTAPLQKTMTPKTNANQQKATGAQNAAAAAKQRSGFFGGGFFGSMLGGLFLGGMLGMLFGSGFGGLGGVFGFLIQGLLLFFAIRFIMGMMRKRQEQVQPQPEVNMNRFYQNAQSDAGSQNGAQPLGNIFDFQRDTQSQPTASGRSGIPNTGFGGSPNAASEPEQAPVFSTQADDQLGITADDFDAFEEMLTKVWTAYGSENYGAIRELTTPEIMGFFAEELGQAASNGLVNEVRDIKLLQGDLSESWHEDGSDYATVAMRYESIDVMRERATNKVVEGNADVPQEVTELWTFIRTPGEPWKLSAIQQVD